MSKGFTSNYRIFLLAGVLLACFGALGVRLFFLHVVDRETLLANAARARDKRVVEKARRGDILDARGAKLATSHSIMVVAVDPQALRAKDMPKWPALAALMGISEELLREKFTTKYRAASKTPATNAAAAAATTTAAAPADASSIVLKFGADQPAVNLAADANTAASTDAAPADETVSDGEEDDETDANGRKLIRWTKVTEVSESTFREIEKLGVKGIIGERAYRRIYPHNQLASHIVGYVNRQEKPAAGMEAYADFYLRAQDGWWVGEQDGRRRALAQFGVREVPPVNGDDVVLSIDSAVQDIVEQELELIRTKFKPVKATIIVSDPRTGFILGMANYPTFDPNKYNEVKKSEEARMKNAAITDVYEPGSVFKIVSVAGALEEGLVTPSRVFDCSLEKIAYKDRIIKLPREDHPMHDLTVEEIVAHSSNKGAAQLGMLLGEQRLYNYTLAFGFARKLGFPGGTEVSGIFARPEKWSGIDIAHIPMGHTIASTALQMHQAMTVIANDGVLLRPQIIREIRTATGERSFVYGPSEISRVVSSKTAQQVAKMLAAVATKDGTAPEASIPGFEVAGKTGTTQKLIYETLANGKQRPIGYSSQNHVASFVGFFPATRPQVAISVIVDDADVPGVAYGKKVAAPSFKSIGEKLIPILNIKAPSANTPVPVNVFAATEGARR